MLFLLRNSRQHLTKINTELIHNNVNSSKYRRNANVCFLINNQYKAIKTTANPNKQYKNMFYKAIKTTEHPNKQYKNMFYKAIKRTAHPNKLYKNMFYKAIKTIVHPNKQYKNMF
jgi:hypothetical protein